MYRALILLVFLAGCNSITVNLYGDNNKLSIEQPKTVGVSPSVEASGNTVPASIIP